MENIVEQFESSAPAEKPEITASIKPRAEGVFNGLWASLFYSGKSGSRSVLICSADRGEGASTIAAGLAVAGGMPHGASKVALADFNFRKPALHNIFDLPQSPGIVEAVLQNIPFDSIAIPVTEGLDIFPAGQANGKMLDILRSGAVEGFLAALTGKYDYVLIDTAAANHYPDAQILAGIVREVMLVSHTEHTPREAVAQAKKRLESGGGKVIGVVLNMRTYPIPKFLYNRV